MKLIHYPGQEAGAAARGWAPGGSRLPDPGDAGRSLRPRGGDGPGLDPGAPLPGPWWSTSASCWSSPPTATSRPPCTGCRARRPGCHALLRLLHGGQAGRDGAAAVTLPELAALAEGPQSDPANPLFYQVGRTCSGTAALPPGCGGPPLWRRPGVRQSADNQRADDKERAARATARLTQPCSIKTGAPRRPDNTSSWATAWQ